jgi:hypothetical protein
MVAVEEAEDDKLIVYVAVATELLAAPSTAIALSVSVELTLMGIVYRVAEVVGVVPSVV